MSLASDFVIHSTKMESNSRVLISGDVATQQKELIDDGNSIIAYTLFY